MDDLEMQISESEGIDYSFSISDCIILCGYLFFDILLVVVFVLLFAWGSIYLLNMLI
jgi:hypothetical protein